MTSLDELLGLDSRLTIFRIERWIARGLLRPLDSNEGGGAGTWTFEQIDVARARLLGELVEDVGFDDDTLETVIALIDQVHTLRHQLHQLGRAIGEQPAETRQAIGAALELLRAR